MYMYDMRLIIVDYQVNKDDICLPPPPSYSDAFMPNPDNSIRQYDPTEVDQHAAPSRSQEPYHQQATVIVQQPQV